MYYLTTKQTDRVRAKIREIKALLETLGDPLIPAKEWREMSTSDILGSIEVATRILKTRKLTKEEKKLASEIAKDLIDLTMNLPEKERLKPHKALHSEEELPPKEAGLKREEDLERRVKELFEKSEEETVGHTPEEISEEEAKEILRNYEEMKEALKGD